MQIKRHITLSPVYTQSGHERNGDETCKNRPITVETRDARYMDDLPLVNSRKSSSRFFHPCFGVNRTLQYDINLS